MLKFILWYIIGTIVLSVIDGIFVAAWGTIRKIPDERSHEFMLKARGKANQPLSRFKSPVALIIMTILMTPVLDIAAVVYTVQQMDAYANKSKEVS